MSWTAGDAVDRSIVRARQHSGTFLLGLALVRARTAGRLAGYGLMAWAVLHGLSFSPYVEVVGATAQAIGLGVAAAVLLRQPGAAAAVPEPYELVPR